MTEGHAVAHFVYGGESTKDTERRYTCPDRQDADRQCGLSGKVWNQATDVGSDPETWSEPIGTTGLVERNGLFYNDPNACMTPYVLRGLRTPGVLDKMLKTDPVVYAGFRAMVNTISQASATFTPAGGAGNPTSLETEIAEWWEWTINNMAGGQRAFWELTAPYPYYGFVGGEPITAWADTPWGRKLCLSRIDPRLPRSVSWWVIHQTGAKRGQVAGVAQGARWGEARVIIPIERFILWTHAEPWNGPEGFAMGRPAHFAWKAKRDVQLGDAGVQERWKYGIPIFEQSSPKQDAAYDKKTRTAIRDAMKDYVTRLNGFLMPPHGFKFSVQFPTKDAPDPVSRIDYLNKEILFVTHSLWLYPMAGTGKVTAEHRIDHASNMTHHATSTLEVLTSEGRPGSGILRDLARANYAIPGNFRWPTPRVTGIQHRNISEKLKNVMLLLQSGDFNFSNALERWLLEELGAPAQVMMDAMRDDDDPIEVRDNESVDNELNAPAEAPE